MTDLFQTADVFAADSDAPDAPAAPADGRVWRAAEAVWSVEAAVAAIIGVRDGVMSARVAEMAISRAAADLTTLRDHAPHLAREVARLATILQWASDTDLDVTEVAAVA